ncbi:MAG: hypothetical protein IT380_24095 [Myxococcales bacterium]|nr:hypothetical protein [Myxococcales bacterium]
MRTLWAGGLALLLLSCSSTPPAVACNAGETLCGGSCARLNVDDRNCGGCGTSCAAGTACANAACHPKSCGAAACDPSSVCFEDTCTDKACVGVVCPTGLSCSQGTCVCASGRLTCTGACVDPLTNEENCGGCGAPCGADTTCVQGACLPDDCPQEDCDPLSVCYQGACVEAACVGVVCAGGQVCQGGLCGCAPKDTVCGGQCVDPKTSDAHCGACDVGCDATSRCAAGACLPAECPSQTCDPLSVCYQGSCVEAACVGVVCGGGQLCSAGVCTCPAGRTLCDGACVDLLGSNAHCGRCGTTCASGQACASGTCVGNTCPVGQTPCAGGCADTAIDPAHCGACGAACGFGRNCVGGACECPPGLTLCGTACVNLATDAVNCGRCARPCGAGTCSGGVCQCPAGQTSCDGTCVSLGTDAMNCGMCNRACPTGQLCALGTCACPPGQSLCGGQCIPTTADNLNCGACNNVCPSGLSCSNSGCVAPFTCQTNYNTPPADCAAFPITLANCGQPTTTTTEGPFTGVLASSGQRAVVPLTVGPAELVRVTATLLGSGGGTSHRIGYLTDAGVELDSSTGVTSSSSPTIKALERRGNLLSCAHPAGFQVANTFGSNLSYSLQVEHLATNGRMNVGGLSPMSPTALRTNTAGRTCDQVCGTLTRECTDTLQTFSVVIPAGKAALFNYAAISGVPGGTGSVYYLYALETNGNSICELVRNQLVNDGLWHFWQARLVNNTSQTQTVVVQPTNTWGGDLSDQFQLSVAVEP